MKRKLKARWLPFAINRVICPVTPASSRQSDLKFIAYTPQFMLLKFFHPHNTACINGTI